MQSYQNGKEFLKKIWENITEGREAIMKQVREMERIGKEDCEVSAEFFEIVKQMTENCPTTNYEQQKQQM